MSGADGCIGEGGRGGDEYSYFFFFALLASDVTNTGRLAATTYILSREPHLVNQESNLSILNITIGTIENTEHFGVRLDCDP